MARGNTISFNVVAHDLASRKFRQVGRAALGMAAAVTAANRAMGAWDNRLTRHTAFWVKFWLASLPLMPPLLASTAAGLGALNSAVVSVTPGLGAMGLALLGAWMALKKASDEGETLPGRMGQALRSFENMGRAYERFLRRTAESSGLVFTRLFNLATSLLDKAAPLANTFNRVFGGWVRELEKGVNSKAFGAWLRWFERIGAVNFRNLLDTLANLTRFLGELGRSFSDEGVSFTAWLKNVTNDWAKWARNLRTNKDFQAFLDYVDRVLPKLRRIWSNVVEFARNLMVGLAPLSEDVLDILVKFTGWLADLEPRQIERAARGIIAFSIAMKALAGAAALLKGSIYTLILLDRILGRGGRGGGLGNAGKSAGGVSRLSAALRGLGRAFAFLAGPMGLVLGASGWLLFKEHPLQGPTETVKRIARALRREFGHIKVPNIRVAVKVVGLATVRALGRLLGRITGKLVRVVIRVLNLRILRLAVSTAARLVSKLVRFTLRVPGLRTVALAVTTARRLVSRIIAYRLLVPGLKILMSAVAWSRRLFSKRIFFRVAVPGLSTLMRAVAWSRRLFSKRVFFRIIVWGLGRLASAVSWARNLFSKTVTFGINVTGLSTLSLAKRLMGNAAGGPVFHRKPIWVGENGPEMFVPGSDGRIVPNHDLGKPGRGGPGGGGDSWHVQVTINGAVDPVATGREVQRVLLELKRTLGGRPLGLG